ncbi:MAG TPA: ImmA/IrrE family metallo-endopeptidase [Streptosporangiaceae bacterium]|jgi:predicted transcriptional regulator
MNEQKPSAMKKLRDIMPARTVSLTEAYMLAERQATELLKLLEVRSVPVPVWRIGELPRIEIQVESRDYMVDKSGFSHRWENGRWLIVVNKHDVRGRRRFTLAHELKHVLDHSIASVAYAQLGHGDQQRRDRQIEGICHHFAACLLMPRPVVKRAWTSGIQDLEALSELFKVSTMAMQVRLDYLGLTDEERPIATYFRRDHSIDLPLLIPDSFPIPVLGAIN